MINLSSAVRKLIDVRIKEYIKYAVEKPLYGLLTGAIFDNYFFKFFRFTALTRRVGKRRNDQLLPISLAII